MKITRRVHQWWRYWRVAAEMFVLQNFARLAFAMLTWIYDKVLILAVASIFFFIRGRIIKVRIARD